MALLAAVPFYYITYDNRQMHRVCVDSNIFDSRHFACMIDTTLKSNHQWPNVVIRTPMKNRGGEQWGLDPLPPGFNPPNPSQIFLPTPRPLFSYIYIFRDPRPKCWFFAPAHLTPAPGPRHPTSPIFRQKPSTPDPLTPGPPTPVLPHPKNRMSCFM